MAELTDEHRRFIVEQLACYRTPVEVVKLLHDEYGIESDRRQIGGLDPTRPYFEAAQKWREVFEIRRQAYLTDVQSVPVANQGYRLQLLQEGIEDARKKRNWPLVQSLMEQAAKEVGGMLTNEQRHRIEDNRASAGMEPDERRMAMAELISRALAGPPMKLAPPIDVEAKEIER